MKRRLKGSSKVLPCEVPSARTRKAPRRFSPPARTEERRRPRVSRRRPAAPVVQMPVKRSMSFAEQEDPTTAEMVACAPLSFLPPLRARSSARDVATLLGEEDYAGSSTESMESDFDDAPKIPFPQLNLQVCPITVLLIRS